MTDKGKSLKTSVVCFFADVIPIFKYLKDSKGTLCCSTFFEMVLCRGWSIIIIYIVYPSKECPSALSKTVLRNTDFKATLRTLQIPGKGIKVIGKHSTADITREELWFLWGGTILVRFLSLGTLIQHLHTLLIYYYVKSLCTLFWVNGPKCSFTAW